MQTKNKPFSAATWGRRASTSVMFSAHYTDGHIEYFVLPNDEKSLGDDGMQVARERQEAGEISKGCIATVKRAR
jgi:hypothetical protein